MEQLFEFEEERIVRHVAGQVSLSREKSRFLETRTREASGTTATSSSLFPIRVWRAPPACIRLAKT